MAGFKVQRESKMKRKEVGYKLKVVNGIVDSVDKRAVRHRAL